MNCETNEEVEDWKSSAQENNKTYLPLLVSFCPQKHTHTRLEELQTGLYRTKIKLYDAVFTQLGNQKKSGKHDAEGSCSQIHNEFNSALAFHEALQKMKHKVSDEDIIIFVDGSDPEFFADETQTAKLFNEKFAKHGQKILIASEDSPWPVIPVTNCPSDYEDFWNRKFPYAGGVAGKWKFLSSFADAFPVVVDETLQAYFSRAFCNKTVVLTYKITLDKNCEFFCFRDSFVTNQFRLSKTPNNPVKIVNVRTNTSPLLLIRKDPIQMYQDMNERLMTFMGNHQHVRDDVYNPYSKSIFRGHLNNSKSKTFDNQTKWPVVLVNIVIDADYPFMVEFFQYLTDLKYPAKKLYFQIQTKTPKFSQNI